LPGFEIFRGAGLIVKWRTLGLPNAVDLRAEPPRQATVGVGSERGVGASAWLLLVVHCGRLTPGSA
jgi:hypothetical protein